ncbi:MAG: VWA domain-containing protein, partial [Bdellovibrionales bacterium]|nr:VWA domain-containing protein [Bdellovibrionales bacterium]
MTFAYPYILGAPILFLASLIWRNREVTNKAVSISSIQPFIEIAPTFRLRIRKPLLTFLFASFVILISIAAARPQRTHVISDEYKSRDLMLVIDISGSMKERDFVSGRSALSRLEAVKIVLSKFIEERTGDRLGLVAFGSNAFLQA